MQLTIIFIAIIVASLVNVSTCNFAEGGDMRNVVLEQMNDEYEERLIQLEKEGNENL